VTEVDIRVNKDRFQGLPRDRVLIIFKHELGHLLGLNHFDGPADAVMHSRLPSRIPGIMPDDREGIDALYRGPAFNSDILMDLYDEDAGTERFGSDLDRVSVHKCTLD